MDIVARSTKRVHFDPSFEAEEEKRRLRSLARQEEKMVGLLLGCLVACRSPSTVGVREMFDGYIRRYERTETSLHVFI
jgi:hypothetical protein